MRRFGADRELKRAAALGLLGVRVGRHACDRKNKCEPARKSKNR